MKLCSLLLFTIFIRSIAFAQPDAVDKFNAHKFPCDSAGSTLEINLCAGEKSQYADSILNVIYKKITRSLDKSIITDRNKLRTIQSKKDTSAKARENIHFLTEEIDYYQRLKTSIVLSQKEWLKLRELNSDVVRITCEGGSACVAMDNLAEVDDTLERIKKLLSFYDVDD